MSEMADRIPERLRQAISGDLEPVTPLPAPWKRVLWAVPLMLVVFSGPLLWFGLRGDVGRLGPLLAWGPTVLQAALGLAILTLALREAVPGLRISRNLVAAVCGVALTLHLVFNLLVYLRSPIGLERFFRGWWECLRHEVLLAVPFLVVVTWLASSALPVRPRVVGLLTGAGAGFLADASWRMICPISSPLHVLAAHGGAIVVLGGLGYLLGWIWEWRLAARPPV